MKKKTWIIIISLGIASLCNAVATNYYVDIATGNDATADGTNPATPYKNIFTAYAVADDAVNGEWVIYVKAGTYPETDTGSGRILFAAAASGDTGSIIGVQDFDNLTTAGTVIIQGSNSANTLSLGNATAGTFTFKNLTVRANAFNASTACRFYADTADTKSATFENCKFEKTGGETGSYVCFSAGINYPTVDASTGTITFTNCQFSITAAVSANPILIKAYAGVTFTDCTFDDETQPYLIQNTSSVSIDSSEVYGTLTMTSITTVSVTNGSTVTDGIDMTNAAATSLTVTDSTVGTGITVVNCPFVRLSGNYFTRTTTGNFLTVDNKSRLIDVQKNRFVVTGDDVGGIYINTQSVSSKNISAITKTSHTGDTDTAMTIDTSAAHGFVNNDKVQILNVGGMTELNNDKFYRYYIATKIDDDTFTIKTEQGAPVDSAAFTDFTSGGYAYEITPMLYECKINICSNYFTNTNPNAVLYQNRNASISICFADGAFIYGNILNKSGVEAISLYNCMATTVLNNFVQGQDSITVKGGYANNIINNTLIGEKGAAVYFGWPDNRNGFFARLCNVINNVMITDEGNNDIPLNTGDRGPIFYQGEGTSGAGSTAETALNYFDYNWYWSNETDSGKFAIARLNNEVITSLTTATEGLQDKWNAFTTYDTNNDENSFMASIPRTSNFVATSGIGKGMPKQIDSAGNTAIKGDIGATENKTVQTGRTRNKGF